MNIASSPAPKWDVDAIHPNKDIARRLLKIYGLHRKNMDFRLTRSPFENLLLKLGAPHKSLPPVIHVAGTNGKGSMVAMLRSILKAHGYTAHAYTSPHLITFNERIVLAGEEIKDDLLMHYLDMVDTENAGGEVTFFEFTTALAFKAFADINADFTLLEVGLGGRLDCTNIIPEPALCIIGNIGFDHTDILGEKIEQIAAEKAGIIKENTPVIIAPQRYDAAKKIIQKIAKEKNAPIIPLKEYPNTYPAPGLVGEHQKNNAQAVLAALCELSNNKWTFEQEKIQGGLKKASWPARLQNITEQVQIPKGTEVWLDGGHNKDAAEIITRQCKAWAKETPKPMTLILGMQASKDVNGFLAPLRPYFKEIICVDMLHAMHPQTADQLRSQISDHGHIKTAHGFIEACKMVAPGARILIAGSLYLAGNILQTIKNS